MSNPTVRASLIVAATILAFIGLFASVQDNWWLSSFVWTAAFFCKWIECWLLEKWLVVAQEDLAAALYRESRAGER